jgi:flagellar hook assembly protein FlgD
LWTLHVSSDAGLRNVVNYPNPFTSTTQFVFSTDVTIDQGTIDVFTVSGKRIARLEIPPGARSPGQNAVFWDGRDSAGGEIANGVYLYVIRVNQRGQETTIRGKMARMR